MLKRENRNSIKIKPNMEAYRRDSRECLFCSASFHNEAAAATSDPTETYAPNLIKFLRFHRISTGVEQNLLHQSEIYYQSLFGNTGLYCRQCARKVEEISLAIEQFEHVVQKLSNLQHRTSTQLRLSLRSPSQLNKHRKHVLKELQSTLDQQESTGTSDHGCSYFDLGTSDSIYEATAALPSSELGTTVNNIIAGNTHTITERDPTAAYVKLIPLELLQLPNSMRHSNQTHMNTTLDCKLYKFPNDNEDNLDFSSEMTDPLRNSDEDALVFVDLQQGSAYFSENNQILEETPNGPIKQESPTETLISSGLDTTYNSSPNTALALLSKSKKSRKKKLKHQRLPDSNSFNELTIHVLEQLELPCQYSDCKFTGTSKIGLETHVNEEHIKDKNPENYICLRCGAVFQNTTTEEKESIEQHSEAHSRERRTYACKYCIRDFCRLESLNTHFRKKHESIYEKLVSGNGLSGVSLTCKFCTVSFPAECFWNHLKKKHKSDLIQMKSVDGPIEQVGQYKCGLCPLSCDTIGPIWRHQNDEHMKQITETVGDVNAEPGIQFTSSKPENICEHCGRMFKNKSRFLQHIKQHEQSFPCSLCSSVFQVKRSLTEHQETHHPTEFNVGGCGTCQCSQCGKVLSNPASLKYHIRVCHNKEYGYVCHECPFRSFYRNQLNRHILVSHKKERNISCTLCDATFLLQHKLNVHMRKHTGEKPYVCKHCGKAFARRDHWTRHEPTHESARPFPCSLCGIRFPTTHNLRGHMRSHHRNKGVGAVKPTRKSKYNQFD